MTTSIYCMMTSVRVKNDMKNVFFALFLAEFRKKAVPLHVFCKTRIKTTNKYGLCERKI